MSRDMKSASDASSELTLDLTRTDFKWAVSRRRGQNAGVRREHAREAASGRFKKRGQGPGAGKTVTNRAPGAPASFRNDLEVEDSQCQMSNGTRVPVPSGHRPGSLPLVGCFRS